MADEDRRIFRLVAAAAGDETRPPGARAADVARILEGSGRRAVGFDRGEMESTAVSPGEVLNRIAAVLRRSEEWTDETLVEILLLLMAGSAGRLPLSLDADDASSRAA